MLISRGFKACMLVLTLSASWDAAVSQAAAQDYESLSCGDLWYRRNAIYARNGYCFKTDRGIRVFGNAGCRFYSEGDVPMSGAERRRVQIIRSIERQKGC
ncbi:MAG: YARHG domain-containing protein [Rhodomicrobium sp.]|nr:YARHG domain-containing protein [Rhodomicrobium sp.]